MQVLKIFEKTLHSYPKAFDIELAEVWTYGWT